MGNVTVNGLPLAEVVANVATQEIINVVSSENKFRRKPIVSTYNGNTSGAKSSKGEVVYVAGQKAQKVRHCNEVFDWKVKAPFTPSGFSVEGGIELSADETEVKCHECGCWFKGIGHHVRTHGITSRDYRLKHGINQQSSLNSGEALGRARVANAGRKTSFTYGNKFNSVNRSAVVRRELALRRPAEVKGRSENNNLKMLCEAQRLSAIRALAVQLGRTPTYLELSRYTDENGRKPLHPDSLKDLFGVRVPLVLLRAGLELRRVGSAGRSRAVV